MTPARRGQPEGEPSTRDALMDAALDQLRSKGALAGLNLREVADAVGVAPANIYYFFGDRQGLLRAAINRELGRLAGPMSALEDTPFAERRVRMFDAVVGLPSLRLSALLALDGDPDYQPLPFLPTSREEWQRQVDAGDLPDDLDMEALHLVTVATTIGVSIYAAAAARQLGLDEDELIRRTREMIDQMVSGLIEAPTGPPPRRESSGPPGR